MNLLVLGAGAIGSVFGGFLALGGHRVCLLGRGPHIEAIRRQGLLIDGIWGKHCVHSLSGYVTLKELREKEKKPFAAALLTVKSYATENMLEEFITCYPDSPPVVSLQNGLGNLEKLEASVGKKKVIGGRVIFGVEFIEPGHVTVTVSADKTILGGLPGGIDKPFVESLAGAFTKSNIPSDTTDDIHRYIWGKVIYNSALNGLATILNVKYGQLLACDETKHIMENIVQEIFAVAAAKHLSLDWQAPEEYRELLFSRLIPLTFNHHPSMLQDIQRRKRTEIDALNGAVVRMGSELGMELHYNLTITRLIKARESFSNAIHQ